MKVTFMLSLGIMVSCSNKAKDGLYTDGEYANVEFSVSEQTNISHYEIEISPDGKEYGIGEEFDASNKAEDFYSKKVRVAEIFKKSDRVNVRIKIVDKDGKFEYYPQTYWVNRP